MNSREQKKQNSTILYIILLLCVFSIVHFLYYQTIPKNLTKAKENGQVFLQEGEERKRQVLSKETDLLILVNPENPLPENYFTWFAIIEGYIVSKTLEEDLVQMLGDARKDGIPLKINSSYRSILEQEELWNSRVEALRKIGYSSEMAEREVEKTVSRAGYSEHHTGLAIDFSNPGHYKENQEMWNWLKENAVQYGFILRYPSDKQEVTNVSYEPWHYRYVGKKDSLRIKEANLSLEEYVINQ